MPERLTLGQVIKDAASHLLGYPLDLVAPRARAVRFDGVCLGVGRQIGKEVLGSHGIWILPDYERGDRIERKTGSSR